MTVGKDKTPAWFANATDGKKFASEFEVRDFHGKKLKLALNTDMDLSITVGDATSIYQAKSNDWGPFWVVSHDDKRYFVSRRTSKKDGAFYLLVKEAVDRPDYGGRPTARPATYG